MLVSLLLVSCTVSKTGGADTAPSPSGTASSAPSASPSSDSECGPKSCESKSITKSVITTEPWKAAIDLGYEATDEAKKSCGWSCNEDKCIEDAKKESTVKIELIGGTPCGEKFNKNAYGEAKSNAKDAIACGISDPGHLLTCIAERVFRRAFKAAYDKIVEDAKPQCSEIEGCKGSLPQITITDMKGGGDKDTGTFWVNITAEVQCVKISGRPKYNVTVIFKANFTCKPKDSPSPTPTPSPTVTSTPTPSPIETKTPTPSLSPKPSPS